MSEHDRKRCGRHNERVAVGRLAQVVVLCGRAADERPGRRGLRARPTGGRPGISAHGVRRVGIALEHDGQQGPCGSSRASPTTRPAGRPRAPGAHAGRAPRGTTTEAVPSVPAGKLSSSSSCPVSASTSSVNCCCCVSVGSISVSPSARTRRTIAEPSHRTRARSGMRRARPANAPRVGGVVACRRAGSRPERAPAGDEQRRGQRSEAEEHRQGDAGGAERPDGLRAADPGEQECQQCGHDRRPLARIGGAALRSAVRIATCVFCSRSSSSR